MLIKFIYARGERLLQAVIEAPTVKEAMKRGYAQCQWDSILESTTTDNKPLGANTPVHKPA
jgi:hypothetical protein